jgi:subtilase family serine protease
MRVARPLAAVVGALALAGALAGAATGGSLGAAARPAGSVPPRRALTGPPAQPVVLIRPDLVRLHRVQQMPSTAYCEQQFKIACYTAAQIRRAFDLLPLYRRGITGTGETIVVVDSFGSPTVGHDLAVFDRASGLPPPPALTIIEPAGPVTGYRADGSREGWAGETDLDVEYAHAIAPGARILVVETPTAENEGTTGFPAIVEAEKYVIDHHLGDVISQSFSATEESFARPQRLLGLRGAYKLAFREGVTVLAASGDSGAADLQYNGTTYYLRPVTSWPDSDPLVTGVGGIQLHLNAAGRDVARPTVWNDSFSQPTLQYITGSSVDSPLAGGGGESAIFGRPAYQDSVANVVGTRRGVPDISMSGACDGAVDMYQSFPGQPAGWYPACGTSEATPEFAGIVALADQVAGHSIGLINPYLYVMSLYRAAGIVDVLSGNNTVRFRQGGEWHVVAGYAAGPGYNLATGVGTVNAQLFVPELACLATHLRDPVLRAVQACGLANAKPDRITATSGPSATATSGPSATATSGPSATATSGPSATAWSAFWSGGSGHSQ